MAPEISLHSQNCNIVHNNNKPLEQSLPRDYLYGSKGILTSPDSLSGLLAAHRALRRKHGGLPVTFKKEVTDNNSEPVDYGYGEEPAPSQEPQSKRRRMQRRNSKTPAMLMAMSASIVASEFLEKGEQEVCKTKEAQLPGWDDSWDGGIDIAEDIVNHLQTRRQNISSGSVEKI
eukprot:CAMPEP_0198144358 /NCGR_PEP_ID=MMETSP1443-20131203/14932_1 /TAXON_ID=186043 /ORGANISM="Entomoneis sp., Strain CCMP2396" /LENGTH=173 /DNA_ID=CAMNT_0043807735 /DNA_START=95 /DNA_END=616 /DNA_ORIENTATION=+